MAYTKHTWRQRLGTGLNKFKDTITNTVFALVNQPDNLTQAGTPLRADWLNEMETGIFNAHVMADAALPAASYTAADVLDKLKTVDGTGSGLDADTVQGYKPTSGATPNTIVQRYSNGVAAIADPLAADHIANKRYVDAQTTAAEILTRLKTVDGSGSDLDADKLRGLVPSILMAANTIVQRSSEGTFSIQPPVNGTHPATKTYVDNKITYGTTVPATLEAGQVFVKI